MLRLLKKNEKCNPADKIRMNNVIQLTKFIILAVNFSPMEIKRSLEARIEGLVGRNKVILLFGARRVGKTHLVRRIAHTFRDRVLMLNAEDFDVQEVLKNRSVANYQRLIGDATLLIIDEAQVVGEIGSILKLMIDSRPDLTIIATGSSSLELTNSTGDPLTGRQYPFSLYPVAQFELGPDPLKTRQDLEERLVYGSYPEVFQLGSFQEKESYVKELARSYLLKDILSMSGIKHASKLIDLLRLISYQIGSEVSYHEIGQKLGMNKITVEHYLDLLQKVFVLFRLPSYSTNLRNEISKGSKWFFHDLGIRNAVINDFRGLSMRNDQGMLWENYIISERMKRNAYKNEDRELYFWRNYNQNEVDLVETFGGVLTAYEIKYGSGQRAKLPLAFRTNYPETVFQVIDRDNYLDFICG
jgi:predicted AAA+ superfamily ATPase